MPRSSRRDFISGSAKAGIGTILAANGIGALFSASASAKSAMSFNPFTTGFDQKPLPYAYNALEPWIDAETMDIHYNKHAAAYSKNVKEAAKAENVDMNQPVESVLESITKYSTKMRNNAGGHYNHELFWQCLTNKTTKPADSFLNAIEKDFGTLANFQRKFEDAAKSRFGSGWAWLVYTKDKSLIITSTANQDNPLMNLPGTTSDPFLKGFPVFGLDVWEHAYYLKYQNRRAEYVDNFWKILNWEYVQQRFDTVRL